MHVPPMGYDTNTVRDELNRVRHPFRIAIVRAKNGFNIGAIIRVAHSFLVKEIILIGDAPYYERAAMGMQKYENIVEIPSEEIFLEQAQTKGWPLVAFEKDHAAEGLWEGDIPENAVLVFGNENDGLSRNIIAQAHSVIGIPMYGINHSYPITAAASMAMAEWARRYYKGGRTVLPSAKDSPSTTVLKSA